MPRHLFTSSLSDPTPSTISLPRKPAPIGLSREQLRKIVTDLIG